MLIWSGHGILIPIFYILGFVFAAVITSVMNLSSDWAMVVGGWIGAAAVLLYARTIGKTKSQTLIDPKTNLPVVLNKRHSLFFIPAIAWAVLLIILAFVITIGGVVSSVGGGSVAATPEEAAFEKANNIIDSHRNGIASGNTPEAEAMAKEFSDSIKMFRNIMIEPAKKKGISMSGGEFLTYCQQSEGVCLFIVHVPKLRKFADDAKETIRTAAWIAAQRAVESAEPMPKKIAVGVRGFVIYDALLEGAVSNGTEEDPEESIESRDIGSVSTGKFHKFFVESNPSSEIEAVAPAGEEVEPAPSDDTEKEAA